MVTAGPGVTNTVSAVTTAHFNGSPVVVLGGRALAWRWGTGSLQELDHVPLLAPVTRHAATISSVDDIGAGVRQAFEAATTPHRGPAFVDVPMDVLFSRSQIYTSPSPAVAAAAVEPDDGALDAAAAVLAEANHPVLVLGSDVWTGCADAAAREVAELLGLPVITNGMGRGVLPAGHPQLVTRARSRALKGADVVLGDGGDFVSFAGRFVEPRTPGGWMDPGPFGCLGTGPGYAIAAGSRGRRPRSSSCSATAPPASP